MKNLLCLLLVAALVWAPSGEIFAQSRSGVKTFQTAQSVHIMATDQFGNSINTHASWSAVPASVLEEYYAQIMASVLNRAPPPTILVLESHKDQIQRLQNMSRKYKRPAKIILVPDALYAELASAHPTLGAELGQAPLFGIAPGSRKIFVRPTRSDWYVGGIVTVLGAMISYHAMIVGGGMDPDVVFKVLAFHTSTVALFQVGHTTMDNIFHFRFGFSKNAVSRKEQLVFRLFWDTLTKTLIRSIVGPVGFAHSISETAGKIEIAQNVAASSGGGIPYYLTRNQVFRQGDLRSEARRLWWGVNAYVPAVYFSFQDQMGQTGSLLFRFHYGLGEGINIYASTLEMVAFYLFGAGFLITFPELAQGIADIQQALFEAVASVGRQCAQALNLIKKK